VPKIIANRVWVHKDYTHTLPDWASKMYEYLNDVNGVKHMLTWNVLQCNKSMGTQDAAVALLTYKDFDTEPHPELELSQKWYWDIDWGRGPHMTLFKGRDNPPILHRKELMVDSTHPEYKAWAALTKQEEDAGLLGLHNIGNKRQWEYQLKSRRMAIRFGTLIEHVDEFWQKCGICGGMGIFRDGSDCIECGSNGGWWMPVPEEANGNNT
jgi:hypothetical protein